MLPGREISDLQQAKYPGNYMYGRKRTMRLLIVNTLPREDPRAQEAIRVFRWRKEGTSRAAKKPRI